MINARVSQNKAKKVTPDYECIGFPALLELQVKKVTDFCERERLREDTGCGKKGTKWSGCHLIQDSQVGERQLSSKPTVAIAIDWSV